jgi:hypothetical protein
MFENGDRVVVSLTTGLWAKGEVIKVSYTKAGRWYGVQLDDGIEIHGIESFHLTKE